MYCLWNHLKELLQNAIAGRVKQDCGMDIIREIGLQVISILTLVFGIMGITFSLMTLFSPKMIQQVSNVLNRSVNIEKKK